MTTKVNEDLPRGTKFYPAPQDIWGIFDVMLKKSNIDHLKGASEIIKESQSNSEYNRCYTAVSRLVMLDTEEYPRVTMPVNTFAALHSSIYPNLCTKKADYANSAKLTILDIPVGTGYYDTIEVRWDTKRKGFIVYNAPYEGELINNKPMVVNRQINKVIKSKISTLLAELLIDDDADLSIRSGYQYGANPSEKAKLIDECLPKILNDTYEVQELVTLTFVLGLYGKTYDYEKHRYQLDLDKKHNPNIVLPSALRTKLIYLYGGYTLPENYQEWFDGETTTTQETNDD